MIKHFVGLYGQPMDTKTMHNYFDMEKPIKKPIFVKDKPKFVTNDDYVLSFYDGKNVKIYPLKIMSKRKIVHDYVYENGKKIRVSITYSPLTGSPIVYKGLWGISGYVYLNNDVLFDEQNNLMVQMIGKIVHGEDANIGKRVKRWQMVITKMGDIYDGGDNILILDMELGDEYNYDDGETIDYMKNDNIRYPIRAYSGKFHQKKLVYVTNDRRTFVLLNKKDKGDLKYNNKINSFVFDKDDIFVTPMYWFASVNMYGKNELVVV